MQRNSTYNKIKEIIITANTYPSEINTLAERLRNNNNSFIYYKKQGEETIAEPCSIESIKRNITLCINFQLLYDADNCSLTTDGKTGTNPENFDKVLRKVLLEYLEGIGVSLQKLESAIDKIDYANPDRIYDELSPQISEDVFRKCLFLLSLCGISKGENILHGYMKKTYLTDKKFNEL